MTEIIVSIITSIAAIVVAAIGAKNITDSKRQKKFELQRATERRLAMDMVASNIELCDVIAIAVTGGHTNGNVEAARKKAMQAKTAYYAFINKIAAEALVKK